LKHSILLQKTTPSRTNHVSCLKGHLQLGQNGWAFSRTAAFQRITVALGSGICRCSGDR
jgi:hypothetical protein